jgi:hypothetical protein
MLMRINAPCLLVLFVLGLGVQPVAAAGFDGRWSVSRAAPRGCSVVGSVFTITISGSSVKAPGGTGSVSASGAIQFPGRTNNFTGTLQGSSGSGSYSGKCGGSWTATRG